MNFLYFVTCYHTTACVDDGFLDLSLGKGLSKVKTTVFPGRQPNFSPSLDLTNVDLRISKFYQKPAPQRRRQPRRPTRLLPANRAENDRPHFRGPTGWRDASPSRPNATACSASRWTNQKARKPEAWPFDLHALETGASRLRTPPSR